ncbi:MAG: type 1 glutamine amidotransferase domain-containing protein, partial [Calditrichaeota bacterium]|nr:type 1 glutamine amidotransferase domain-containing protein [Calditrichota bacterium]
MSTNIDVLDPEQPKKILMIAANPAISLQTGWPVGFWAAELTHPYYEFVENGYQVEIASPDGGKLEIDSFSDPRHESGYSANDLISMGFLHTPALANLLENTKSIDDVDIATYDAIFLVGGQSPMISFIDNTKLHTYIANFYESGKLVAIVCHATCVLLKIRLSNGNLLV